jgi:hypothetical protein
MREETVHREVSVIAETQSSANSSVQSDQCNSSEEKAPTSAGPSSGRKLPRVGANHGKRGSDHLQRMKSVVHSNSSNSPAHGDLGDPSKRTMTQSVARPSHLRGIWCFQQHHADHPDGLCYQGHLRSPVGGGNSCRDVTSAIASSVSSVIVGGVIISVRRSVSTISLQSELSRSGA